MCFSSTDLKTIGSTRWKRSFLLLPNVPHDLEDTNVPQPSIKWFAFCLWNLTIQFNSKRLQTANPSHEFSSFIGILQTCWTNTFPKINRKEESLDPWSCETASERSWWSIQKNKLRNNRLFRSIRKKLEEPKVWCENNRRQHRLSFSKRKEQTKRNVGACYRISWTVKTNEPLED